MDSLRLIDSKYFHPIIESLPNSSSSNERAINHRLSSAQQTFRREREKRQSVRKCQFIILSISRKVAFIKTAWLLSTAIRRSTALSPLIHLSLTFDSVQRTAWIALDPSTYIFLLPSSPSAPRRSTLLRFEHFHKQKGIPVVVRYSP